MSTDLTELIAALPVQEEPAEPAGELQRVLADISRRKMPVGAFPRIWILGALPVKIAAAYFAHWVRSGYATAQEKQRSFNEANLTAAIKLIGGMGYLRGMIMKIGQALGNYPTLLPQEFMETLGWLHFDAPPMHYALLREHVRNELGADPSEIFAEFETEAFAAASLGQVHRARLKTGVPVAVKVQYPDIGRTIRNDFRVLTALLAPMRLSPDWDNLHQQFADMRQGLERETNYEQEAAHQKDARMAFGEDDNIVVPRVFEEYSTKRILTMEYLEGLHAPQYLARNPPQAERDEFGRLIMLSCFRLNYRARMMYADPHPGNFLFMADGRLGLLDFGCCRYFNEKEWQYYKECTRTFRDGGRAMQETLAAAIDVDSPEDIDPDHLRILTEVVEWYNEPLKTELFDFGSEDYLRRGIGQQREVIRKRYMRSLPINMWINRALLGVRAMANRLGARIPMKQLAEQETAGLLD